MVITLKDIASRAGTSDATVSLALRDHPRISVRRRREIQRLARELNYRPHAVGRALKVGKTMSIGLAVGALDTPISNVKIRAMEVAARDRGYWSYLACLGDPGGPAVADILEDLIGRGIDGLIVFQTWISEAALAKLRDCPLPMVYLDYAPPGERRCVTIRREPAMAQLADHLAGLGHRRAFLVQSTSDAHAPSRKVEPFRRAFAGRGMELATDARMVLPPGKGVDQQAYELVRHLLQGPERPTALVMNNDENAIVALAAAHDLGLRVPDDLSIVGFDGIPLAAFQRPALTTLQQPGAAAGQAALDMLLQLMADPAAAVEPVAFDTELVVRQSTGTAQAHSRLTGKTRQTTRTNN